MRSLVYSLSLGWSERGHSGIVTSADIVENCGVTFVITPRFFTVVHFGDRKTNKEEMTISEEIISVSWGFMKTTLGQAGALTLWASSCEHL